MGNGDTGTDEFFPNRRSRLLGVLTLLVAALAAALVASGIAAAVDGDFAVATTIGYVAVVISILGAALGLTAVIMGAGRLWGAIGMVACVFVNPLVLSGLLAWLGASA